MEILEIADKLTDIVFYGDGVADTAKAIFEAMEKNDADYKNAIYLIYRIMEEQCVRIRHIIDEIGKNHSGESHKISTAEESM